jgi:hypothetical protein
MSQFNQRKNDVSPDQIYYDVTVSNFQSTTNAPLPFYFNESRTIPFINKPEDYNLSVVRFSVDTGNAPVFIPSIQPNQNDPDLTIYSITLKYTKPSTGQTIYGRAFMNWVPQDKSASVPTAPSLTANGLQDNSTGYYNTYSYTFLMLRIYETFQTAVTNILAAAAAASPVIVLNIPNVPVANWDSSSQKLNLYFQADVFDENPANVGSLLNPAVVECYFNVNLFSLFSSTPAVFFGYNQIQGTDWKIGVVNIGDSNLQPLVNPSGSSYDTIVVFQEQSTTSSLSPILAIVFCSSTLPIEANQVSTPVVLNNNQVLGLVGNNAATAPIITDLISDTGTYCPNIVYTPTAQYRYITLYGNAPLTNLDLQIYYRLRNGSLVPFTLQSGGSVTVKFLFEKKKY